MQMFIYLLVAALLIYMLSSLLLPPVVEDEEEDVWDAAELRLESLLQGVVDPRADIRERYRNRILAMGPEVIPRLTEVLSQELFLAQNELRILRLKELLRDFGLRAVPPLLQMLEEEGGDPEVAKAVQELLRDIGSPALRIIIEKLSYPIVMPMLSLFQEWGEPAIKASMKAFRKAPKQSMWRRILLSFGDDVIPYLLDAVDEWKGEARIAAFQILAEFAPIEAQHRFVEALEAPQARLRASAVLALGRIGSPEWLEVIEKRLEDEVPHVRIQAIEAYAEMGQEQSIERLIQLQEQSKDDAERLEETLTTAVALAQLGEPVDSAFVDRALASNTWRLRCMALRLVQHLPADENIAYLERLLWDRDDNMVKEAIQILANQQTRVATFALVNYATEFSPGHVRRGWVSDALLSWRETIVPLLLDGFQKHDSAWKGSLVEILLYGDDPRSVEPILLALHEAEDPEGDWGVEPEELHRFLVRASERADIRETIQKFIKKHDQSWLVPALTYVMHQLQPGSGSQNNLPIDAKRPEVES